MKITTTTPFTEMNVYTPRVIPNEPSSDATSASVKVYCIYTPISGYGNSPNPARMRLRNHKTVQGKMPKANTTWTGFQTQEYSVTLMLQAESVYDTDAVVSIPGSSPVYALQSLQTGWDGYWAEPLSKDVLVKAHKLWEQIEKITQYESDLPFIRPSANGSVAFTWSNYYPRKELEISLLDRKEYYAEWLLSVGDRDIEGTARSQSELLQVIRQYQES